MTQKFVDAMVHLTRLNNPSPAKLLMMHGFEAEGKAVQAVVAEFVNAVRSGEINLRPQGLSSRNVKEPNHEEQQVQNNTSEPKANPGTVRHRVAKGNKPKPAGA